MRVAVIGAGFAGVVTTKVLLQFGHEPVLFEKAPDVGGVWSATRRYPGLSTQNNKDTYCLSDQPWPKSVPEWPSGAQVQQYVEIYARRFGVKLNPDTQVVATLGSKEGFANMAQAITGPGDVVLVPNPSYPIHAFGFLMAGGVIRSVPAEPTPAMFPAR